MALSIQERIGVGTEPIEAALWQWACMLRTATPAKVVSFDPDAQTCVVQIATQEQVFLPPPGNNPHPGTTQNVPTWDTIPNLEDVPILMMRVPGWSITLPITEGTECLLIFADACIDGWYQSGNVSPQFRRRRHSLSDGFALFGPWSHPNKLSNYSTNSMQIRSDDQTVMIELAAGTVNINAPAINLKNIGTPLPLMNDTFYQWYVTNIQPFLVSKGYAGPPIPAGSETTILKGQ
jgi:hypothetical protein